MTSNNILLFLSFLLHSSSFVRPRLLFSLCDLVPLSAVSDDMSKLVTVFLFRCSLIPFIIWHLVDFSWRFSFDVSIVQLCHFLTSEFFFQMRCSCPLCVSSWESSPVIDTFLLSLWVSRYRFCCCLFVPQALRIFFLGGIQWHATSVTIFTSRNKAEIRFAQQKSTVRSTRMFQRLLLWKRKLSWYCSWLSALRQSEYWRISLSWCIDATYCKDKRRDPPVPRDGSWQESQLSLLEVRWRRALSILMRWDTPIFQHCYVFMWLFLSVQRFGYRHVTTCLLCPS